MEMRQLGSRGPEISVIGFGAWEAGGMAWGENPPDDQTLAAMHAAITSGATWIDTAEVYGGGRSEELVGRAVADHPEVMIFTKVAPQSAGSGFKPKQIRAAAEKSIQRLGRDHIDLYQLHWPDRKVPVEETWGAMADLVDAGLVRWIGVSNHDHGLIERCEQVAHVDSLQPHFSMLWQQERAVIEHCATRGTGVIAYGPLGYGLLTGVIGRNHEFHEDDWRGGGHGMRAYDTMFAPGKLEANLDKVDALRPVADRLEITLAQLALLWAFHQNGVTGAIAGSRSPEHVRENNAAGTVELDDKTLEELAGILG